MIRENRGEVIAALFGGNAEKLPGELRERMESKIIRMEDGKYCFRQVTKVSILGWDPNELHFEDAE